MSEIQSTQLTINLGTKIKRLENNFDLNKQEIINLINTSISAKNKTNSKTQILEKLKEIEKIFRETQELLIKENKEKTNAIKNNNTHISQSNQQKRSYAQILKTKNLTEKQETKTKHVITVYPKEENINSITLKSQLKKNLKLNKLGPIGINNIRNIRNNGIIIECNSNNECKLLETEINTNNETKNICEAKIPNKKLPKVIIYNIENDIKEEEILDYLVKQNISVNNYLEGKEIENELKFKYSIK
jgi:hypothetical protein